MFCHPYFYTTDCSRFKAAVKIVAYVYIQGGPENNPIRFAFIYNNTKANMRGKTVA